jgi:hypothetical protein
VKAPAKLAAYAVVLAVVTGGGAVIGAAAGPLDVGGDAGDEAGHDMGTGGEAEGAATAEGHGDATDDTEAHAPATGDGSGGTSAPALPGGLAVAQSGYRLDAATTEVGAGAPAAYRFRVLDGDGMPVTRFDVEHEKRLHLVVVGRDLVNYAHVHPTMTDDGEWAVELPALPAGSYRAFADFAPTGGEPLTLGVDLAVAGPATAVALPAPSHHARVDGYEVTLDGDATRGESELGFTVSLAGAVVRTDPYLGAAGHLVAIREGDLAYLHVHPLDGEGDEVRFAAEFPSAGTYRLFLDFAHGGSVRTAAFTVEVPDRSDPSTAHDAPGSAGGDDEGH